MKKRMLALLLSVLLLAVSMTTVYAQPDDATAADEADTTAVEEETEAVAEDATEEETEAAEEETEAAAGSEEAAEEEEAKPEKKPDVKSELTLDVKVGEPVETIACDVSHIDEPSEDDIAANTYTFLKAAENDRFVLAYDEQTTFVAIYDRKTGQSWYSNPPIAQGTDPYAFGAAITDMRSIMKVTYTNSMNSEDTKSSYAQSVMGGDVEIKIEDAGLRIDYDFGNMDIVIPVRYTLTKDGMIAEILYSEMTSDDNENIINDIDFLTYFGAAGADDEGYFVVPDGAGAIVNFNNGKNAESFKYSKEFYGLDQALAKETDVISSREEKINLPVYGMVKNGYGFLAEVTTGAEMAELKCAVSGSSTIGDYNVIYTSATHHVHYDIPLMGQTGGSTSVATYNAQEAVEDETYSVQFHFAEEKDADYMTLATDYREILTERGWLAQDVISDDLYVDIYGAVSKKKSFVGIVYNARVTLTSFGQAQEILADLKAAGVGNVKVQYLAYSDDTFTTDMEVELTPSGSLGGKKGMAALQQYAAENGVELAMGADFTTLPANSQGFSKFKDTANVINIEPITVFPFSLNGNTVNKNKAPYYLLKGQNLAEAEAILEENAAKNGYTGLYFDEAAVQLYSDLAPEGMQRGELVETQISQYTALAEAGNAITLNNPNAYLFANADNMVDLPVCSSKEQIFDGDIPFLQTVLRGTKNIAGESMNITDVSDDAFLRHIEYGTNIKYSLINAESEALLNTDMTFLYSATYKNFADQIKARYAEFATYSEAVGDAKIVGHTKDDGVAVTSYDNGVKVIVNYNDKAVTVDGAKVEAMSFAVV